MPTPLGYIVALVELLGGGYVGLEWLTSPEDASTYQRPNDEPIAKRNITHQKIAANTVRVIDVPRQPDAPSAPATSGKLNRDEADPAFAQRSPKNANQYPSDPKGLSNTRWSWGTTTFVANEAGAKTRSRRRLSGTMHWACDNSNSTSARD